MLDFAEPDARLIFSCGWHITKDGKDKYSWIMKVLINTAGWIGKALKIVDIQDQVRACDLIFEVIKNGQL